MENNKFVPIAIVAAGLLIAGAVYMQPSSPQENTDPVANGSKGFDIKSLPTIAKQVGLDQAKFNSCLESGKYQDLIAKQSEDASKLGAQGTPFPIVITQSGKTAVLPGAVPFEQMKQLIEDALADKIPEEALVKLPETLKISDTEHINGDPKAPVIIVEYSDMECPFCQRFHETMNQVMQEYGAKGQVAWVFRNLPLTSLHPNAITIAEASECAAELGGNQAYWNFIDKVFGAK